MKTCVETETDEGMIENDDFDGLSCFWMFKAAGDV